MIKTIFLAIIVLGVLGAIFGALLAYASKIFHVEVDPKQAQIRACLAGANCGGCGYPGCDGYAAAVAKGEAPTNRCVAGGEATAARVAEIMGVSGDAADKMVAFVPCSGSLAAAELRFHYHGPEDCRAAMLFGGRSNHLFRLFLCTFQQRFGFLLSLGQTLVVELFCQLLQFILHILKLFAVKATNLIKIAIKRKRMPNLIDILFNHC